MKKDTSNLRSLLYRYIESKPEFPEEISGESWSHLRPILDDLLKRITNERNSLKISSCEFDIIYDSISENIKKSRMSFMDE